MYFSHPILIQVLFLTSPVIIKKYHLQSFALSVARTGLLCEFYTVLITVQVTMSALSKEVSPKQTRAQKEIRCRIFL